MEKSICPECGSDNTDYEWYADNDGYEMCGDCYDTMRGRWTPVREDIRAAFDSSELFVVEYPEDFHF